MRIVFMGTPDFAVPTLTALIEGGHEVVAVVTQPDKPKGRGGKMQYTPVKEAALARDIPVYQPKKIREPECIEELKNAILDFDEDAAVTAAEKIIKEGVSPMDAIDAMGDALKVLGDKFQIMEVFLPEILLATDAFKAGLKVLEPELMKTIDAGSFQEKPKVVIGTVKGDVHAVGKDMVATMLTVGGFDVKDVGADVDSEVFITAAEEFGAQIIGLSALMSTTMPSQKEVIDFLEAKGLRNKYKVIVGGGPVTPQWAEQIGADGFSKDAVEAVELAKSLLK